MGTRPTARAPFQRVAFDYLKIAAIWDNNPVIVLENEQSSNYRCSHPLGRGLSTKRQTAITAATILYDQVICRGG